MSEATGSPAPHMRALQHANEVRTARAKLKRAIAEGQVSAREVLITCPWHAASMAVGELLMTQRGWGRARSSRLLRSVGVSEAKPVRRLTERQRKALAASLMLNGRG